jgi:hypothetical protein
MKGEINNRPMSIEKILFNIRGKIEIRMEDGRIFIIPVKYFPELQKLSIEKRKKYTIVDDRTILFSFSDNVYHLDDFIGLENRWRQK